MSHLGEGTCILRGICPAPEERCNGAEVPAQVKRDLDALVALVRLNECLGVLCVEQSRFKLKSAQ